MAKVVALPFDTILRILNRATTLPMRERHASGETHVSSEPPANPPPPLADLVINALMKAAMFGADDTKHVALPSSADFHELGVWCRAVGLDSDAGIIDAAAR
jgi:hypothetical protein